MVLSSPSKAAVRWKSAARVRTLVDSSSKPAILMLATLVLLLQHRYRCRHKHDKRQRCWISTLSQPAVQVSSEVARPRAIAVRSSLFGVGNKANRR